MNMLRFVVAPRSVRTRLMIWNICVVALLLGVLGAIVQVTIQSVLQIAVPVPICSTPHAVVPSPCQYTLSKRRQTRGKERGGDSRGEDSTRRVE